MPFRFVDLDNQPSGYKDFARRKRSPTLVEQFCLCLAVILTGVAIILMVDDKLELTAILFTVVGLAAVYVNAQTIRNRDLLQATEFQNALFASALSKGNLWYLIAKQSDGEILYRNSDFGTWFPAAQAGSSVGEWLASAGAPQEAAASIAEIIREGQEQKAPLLLHDAARRQHSLTLFIEPVRRPAGFVLIRCRESQAISR